MDLLAVLNSLGRTAPSAIKLLFALMGAFGMVVALRASYDGYRHVCGEQAPGMMPKGAILPVWMLSGALAVIPVILWSSAKTVVLGGQKTYDMFAYLQEPDATANYCDTTTNNMTYLFMVFGLLSVFKAAHMTYTTLTQPGHNGSYGGAATYGLGGILLFFLNDVAQILTNTTGMPIGLQQICSGFVA